MPWDAGSRKAEGAVRLVAFDMDGVLIDHVSSWAAVHDALGTRNRDVVDAFMRGEISDAEFIRRDAALWRRARPDFGPGDLEAILRDVRRMPGLKEAVGELKGAGVTCAIVSGGLQAMARQLAREAGFDLWRANDVVFTPDGRLADGARVDVPLRDKGAVVRALQERLGVGREQTGAVGDSPFDLGMFALSRVSVAFDPKDERVAQQATHVVRSRDLRDVVAPFLDGAREAR